MRHGLNISRDVVFIVCMQNSAKDEPVTSDT